VLGGALALVVSGRAGSAREATAIARAGIADGGAGKTLEALRKFGAEVSHTALMGTGGGDRG
jgi:anthranilate phosphoribosyltransferase